MDDLHPNPAVQAPELDLKGPVADAASMADGVGDELGHEQRQVVLHGWGEGLGVRCDRAPRDSGCFNVAGHDQFESGAHRRTTTASGASEPIQPSRSAMYSSDSPPARSSAS